MQKLVTVEIDVHILYSSCFKPCQVNATNMEHRFCMALRKSLET